MKTSRECCATCKRWSKTASMHIKIAWCLKMRRTTKKDDLCGYYEPNGEER